MRNPDLQIIHDLTDSSALAVSLPNAFPGYFAYLHAFSAETRPCTQAVVTEALKNEKPIFSVQHESPRVLASF